ncbi:3-deoxy-manno-octulosonate cytidylyltransferase [Pelagibacteraceae bacterium]|nr:3-deoxy-manno-octulosonate cytidylyltransferase [Pelagibacteraceae bacterium]
MKKVIIIPARLNSTRFYAKPLKKILNRELVLRVADRCASVLGKENLYVATDHKKIFNIVRKAKYKAVMTSSKCLTGSDRVAEASKKIKSDIYINVQGDEPLVSPNDIKKIISQKIRFPNHIVCGFSKIGLSENPSSINIPKVVMNAKNELLYISRSLIPASKNKNKNKKQKYYKQVCIYAFNKKQLIKYYSMKKKSIIESIEDIEILRFFDLGIKIKMVELKSKTIAVDEKNDIKKVEKILLKKIN